MKPRLLTITLIFQGLYYAVFGALAIFNLLIFFRIVRDAADPYKSQINAVLFIGLGLWYLYGAWRPEARRLAGALAALVALMLAAVTIFYAVQLPWTFRLDAVEEIAAAAVLIVCLYQKEKLPPVA